MATLGSLAKLIRSKNAGPFQLTLDIIFEDPRLYHRVRDSGVLTRELVAGLYHISPELVYMVAYDAGLAIKATFPRPISSGDVRDSDVLGGQQYAPLIDIEIPDESEVMSSI